MSETKPETSIAELKQQVVELRERLLPEPFELSAEALQDKQAAHVAAVMEAMSPLRTYRVMDPHQGERQIHIENPRPTYSNELVTPKPYRS